MLVRDVAAALSAQVVGDGSLAVERVVHPADAAAPSDLAVAMSHEAFSALAASKAQAAVVSEKSPKPHGLKAVIVASHERSALARLTALFDRGPAHQPGIHETAIIAPDAIVGENVNIGPYVVIGPRSRIGAKSIILPNVTIGADVTIGAKALIYSGVQIGDRVSIGQRIIIQSNTSIGCDGFSFLPVPGNEGGADNGATPTRVHSLGTVEIGDDVEIGANTTVARATLEATRIGDGTKIDNQVQIAHNVKIGQSCLICGMVGVSGSVQIGDRVLVAGGVGIADHVKIGSDAMVAAGSGVGTNVPAHGRVSGYPAMPHERTVDIYMFLARHKRLIDDLTEVKSRLETIENSTANKK
jgi:UDP-3-O-[3-hydroxymyristoyl] glucosamine N-acyltransferase